MSWRESLVRLADYRVEELRKRLAVLVDQRISLETALILLQAEAEGEQMHDLDDAEAGWWRVGYLQGWRQRRDDLTRRLEQAKGEELGARDALSEAFEDLKKFELVSENAHVARRAASAKVERAAMDELGLRAATA